MELDPNTTYRRDNDGVLRPVAESGIVWSPTFEVADRINAGLARRIARSAEASQAAWQAGELARMLLHRRRALKLRKLLLSRLPAKCSPYGKGVAA
jgi:hypothetical protein